MAQKVIDQQSGSASPSNLSVVIPARNEANSIERLLQSLQAQTYVPSEIVIADGGSSDDTKRIILNVRQHLQIPVILIEDQNAFPGRARNLAIKSAANEWIACIDAGIIPERNWLEELVKSAESQPDKTVIFGRFQPILNTFFERCAAICYLTPQSLKGPSIASCLLHRSAWKAAGEFREDLRSSEDLLFFKALRAAGVRTGYSEKALVNWILQPTLAGTYRRFATYSRYSMKAGLASDWQFRVSVHYALLAVLALMAWLWWPMILLPPILLLARSQLRIYRWYADEGYAKWLRLLDPRRVLLVTVINIVIDIAMFVGMWQWFVLDQIPNSLKLRSS